MFCRCCRLNELLHIMIYKRVCRLIQKGQATPWKAYKENPSTILMKKYLLNVYTIYPYRGGVSVYKPLLSRKCGGGKCV